MRGYAFLIIFLLLIPVATSAAGKKARVLMVLPMASVATGKNLEVNVLARDVKGVKTVQLFYRRKGSLGYKRLVMRRHNTSDIYKTTVRRLPSVGIEFYVKLVNQQGRSFISGTPSLPKIYAKGRLLKNPKARVAKKTKTPDQTKTLAKKDTRKQREAETQPNRQVVARSPKSLFSRKPLYFGARLAQQSLEYNAFQQGSGGFRLFAGYNLSRFLGLELGYASNGEAQGVDENEALPRYVTMGNSGIDLMGVANLRLNKKMTILGRLGVFLWSSDLKLCFEQNQNNCLTDTDSGISVLYGFGAKYQLSKKFTMLADLSRYNMELEADDVAGNITSLNMGVSLIYSFQ